MPIGNKASYVDAQIFANVTPKNVFGDDDYFLSVSDSDPETDWYNQGWWGNPGGNAHCDIKGSKIGKLKFPHSKIVTAFGNNNAAGILQPDNVTIFQMQPLYRCQVGSPVLALNYFLKHNVSILGDGAYGAHGGSSLSAVGGMIRLDELNKNATQFRHALKLELFAHDYYYKGNPCYHWPALNCDGYHDAKHSKLAYGGNNPHLTPGALLAIQPQHWMSLQSQLQTEAGEKIGFALTYYGGYLVDDTATNRATFCVEHGLEQQFQNEYGYPFDAHEGPFYDDVSTLFKALHIVANNSPDSVGGGGAPLQPRAPPICPV